MKKFLFITTVTPSQFLSPLRKELFELYLKALNSQSYATWEALLIGEVERDEGKIKYIKSDAITKSDRLKVAYDYLNKLEVKPDFIIRLDDDDIISPFALEAASESDFDCYADRSHTFYDLTSGKIAQQKRAWLPNTTIHKYECAISKFDGYDGPLFAHDHSKSWHLFYASKKVIYAPIEQPVYLRIVSPTAISSGSSDVWIETNSVKSDTYTKYLSSFGVWKDFNLNNFLTYKEDLLHIKTKYFALFAQRDKKWYDFLK